MKLLLLCCNLLVAHLLFTQNNAIFNGGNEDGFAQLILTPTYNSAIFNGGDEDGFAELTIVPTYNSAIFNGGNEDGFAALQNELSTSSVEVKVNLQGAFNGTAMNNSLIAISDFPLSVPYSSDDYPLQNPDASMNQAPSSMVDWVVVALRKATAPSEDFIAKAALLLSDGSVVNIDGNLVTFDGIPTANYFVVVYHRNHLAVMTSAAILINTD